MGFHVSGYYTCISSYSCFFFTDAQPNPQAWGSDGELWDRDVLLDWSFSGYSAKEQGYHDPPFAANILDFGAVGDGKMDCTEHFRSAISQVSDAGGGTIIIPEGKYVITKRLVLGKNNVVLQGEGTGKTIIYCPEPLSSIDRIDVEKHIESGFHQSPYSWNDGILQITGVDPGSQDSPVSGNTGWVIQDSKMGQRHLILDSVAGFSPGQWVRILQSDTSGSLASYLYGTDYNKVSSLLQKDDDCEPECASDITNEKDLVRWASRILTIEQGNVVVLQRSLPMDVSPGWKARLMAIPASMPKENGIRDLTLEFAYKESSKHHKDAGYNGILIHNAVNAFVSNVSVVNADQAFLVRNSQLVSLNGVEVTKTKSRSTSGMPWDGHIGIGLYDSSDVEVSDFDIRGEWLHDITVRGSMLSVFHRGRGDNIRLDTHRSAPYAILFSDIYLGKATRVFGTGGYLSRGLPVAKYTTYYNLRNEKHKPIELPSSTVAGPCTWGKLVNYIGMWTGTSCPGYNVEKINGKMVQPRDIYDAMVQRKNDMRVKYETGIVPYANKMAKSGGAEYTASPKIYAAGDGSYPVLNTPAFY